MLQNASTRSGTGMLRALKCMGALTIFAMGACDQEPTAPTAMNPRAPVFDVITKTELIVDTGPGNTDPGLVVAGGSIGFPEWQYLAGQFSVSESTDLESIAGWLKIFVGGNVTVHIRADLSGQPGADIFSKTYTVGTTPTFDWYTFADFNTTLPAGTYWVTLETPLLGGLIISMPRGAASPMDKYAFKSLNLPNWNQSFGFTAPSMGFQIAANVVVTPTELIGDLGSFVAGAGLDASAVSSISSKLTTAVNAIGVNDKPTACGSLGAVINYTRAQTGKKIPGSVASSITSQTNGIRSSLGC